MLKFNIINAEKNIDQDLLFYLKYNQDTEKALVNGITNLKNIKTESGTSFDSLTYLAVNYFYEHIYFYYKEENDGIMKKYRHKRLKTTSLARIKAILDACNYTQYTPIETIKPVEYLELFRSDYYTECYLIIQTAYFFGSKRFGEHPYIETVEHYRKTGDILQKGVDKERLQSAIVKINNFREWEKHPTKFKKKPRQFNKETYLNNWYYGVLDIIANTLDTCKNYKYEYPLKDGIVSEYRLYNKFIQTPRILRKVQPFEMIEFDIKSGHLSYIDLFVGSNIAKTAYENYAKKYNVSRDVAKRKFQSILNLRESRNTWKKKQEYITTLCGFGWTLEQASIILLKITDSPDYLFGHWASNYESRFVIKFAIINNIKCWTRGHDSLNCLKRSDVDYKDFCTSFENGIIQFELEEIGSHQENYSVLQHKFERGKSTDIIAPFSLDNQLNEIKNGVEKYKRTVAEVLHGFLGDRLDELIVFWSVLHINILSSPASSGKTSMVVKLKEKGYRCLLIVPTQAIIKNKNLKGFVQVFGTTSIQKYVDTKESIICTFDKGAQIKVEDFVKFDYFIVDESHLLFTEGYRMNAMVLLLKKIKRHILDIRDNANTSSSTTVILMTGTPTGEEFYFGLDKHGKSITQKNEFINEKKREVTLVGCDDRDSCYTSLINKVIELKNYGHRVLIPTNTGEKWINCVVGNVGYPNFAIYSNNQKYSQVSEDINKMSIINGDNELLFTTTLGNVGIDINNTDKPITMVIYTDNQTSITAQEIEQYANRFRKSYVEIIVFFIVPEKIQYEENFVFNYVEDLKAISLIKNDIATDLFTDEEFVNMQDDYGVDREKVRWKVLNEKLKEHNSNIISIGGYLKMFGYDVNVVKGLCTDSSVIEEYKELLKEQIKLEKESKVRALDFILSDVLNLIKNISNHTIRIGNYSLVDKTLTLENEQIFKSVRSLVKRCVQVSGYVSDFGWIKILMIDCVMNFKEIDNRLKYMKFVNSNLVDDLDSNLVDEVDKIVNMTDGIGSLSRLQYQKMLDALSPKYINKAYNDMDQKTKRKLQENLKRKLDVCYITKYGGKRVELKQRYTQEWKSEVIVWFEDNLGGKLEMEAPINERLLRNRKGEAVGKAIGKAIGLNIGKAYEHVTSDMINEIIKRLGFDGFITVKTIMEITHLSNKSVGGFVKAKFPKLEPKSKMIKGARETRYYN